MSLALDYSALSDVGRVRKDNQDSGYAGPWLLTVCDGVGGAARGDIASATAVGQLATLDRRPTADLLEAVAAGIARAHERIGELVDDDPALNGTSTTVTVALFDGERIGLGHVGDSRAYLYRSGEMSQLTRDHTLVQTLIDEGRLTEEDSRTHPHRNLILKAVDGVHDAEPDLFLLELAPGDRLLLCSDGASGVLTAGRMADVLSSGSPDFAAVELVRASLEAGSSDNVTCVVADVVDPAVTPVRDDLEPLVVGAAAELPRRSKGGFAAGGLFRGHRSGDTGELEPVPADVPSHAIANDPLDPEHARYAPQAPRRFGRLRILLVLVTLVGLLWVAAAAFWVWSQRQYYVAADAGYVTVFRGLDSSLPGVSLSHPYLRSDVALTGLPDFYAQQVSEGISADDLADARRTVADVARNQCPASTDPSSSATPSATASSTASGRPSGTASGSPSGTASGTASGSPSGTASGSASATSSSSPSGSPSGRPSSTPSSPSSSAADGGC